MNMGSLGTFVISWSQTEVDGVAGAPKSLLTVGATWRWSGVIVRIDRPQDVLLLSEANGAADLRKRAARAVRRLVGVAVGSDASAEDGDDRPELPEQGFIVTDGHHSYSLTLIAVPDTGANLLMILGQAPPADQDLWVVRAALDETHSGAGAKVAGGVICFTPETMISTEYGARAIRDIRPGDRILTRDNGPQEVLWRGYRRMTGARLHVMPHLRPVRIRADALGQGRPGEDLLVSPQHRMLIKGPAALALFNTPEVLVAAEDLINDQTIMTDHSARDVTYVHILLEHHNIVWANGLETESFHPSNTALDTVAEDQRASLLEIIPEFAFNPDAYGDYARRNISAAEAAILRFEMRH
jgi:hypothetical protein